MADTTNPNTILVVQQAENQRILTCVSLQQKGYDTIGVGSVAEALEFLTVCSGNVRLVLTDYQLPDYTGYELKVKMEELPGVRRMPVVFLDRYVSPFICH